MAYRLVRSLAPTNQGAFCRRNGRSVQKFRAYPEKASTIHTSGLH
jgi:hypothetical protein